MPSKAEVLEILGDLNKWSHQCHAASIHIVKALPAGTARVARGSCRGVGGQHSWVVLGMDCYDPTTKIIDPTLWSYDDKVKGVYYPNLRERESRYHPHGEGNIYAWGKPVPGGGKVITLDTKGMSDEAVRFLKMVGPLDALGWMRLFSNAPVQGWPAGEIMERAHWHPQIGGLIPIDRLGMLTDLNPHGLYLNGPEKA